MKRRFILTAAMAMCAAMPVMASGQSNAGMMSNTSMDHNMDQKANYWFKQMDKDNNNMISKDEHENFGEMMFDEADTNNDDELSMNELKDQKMREKSKMQQSKM